jgi:hypothetical protein
MPRDVEVQNAPTIVAEDEEAVEHAEGDRRNREEIHRRDGLAVIAKKGEPSLGGVRRFWSSFHPTGNRPLGNIEAEHEEFPMDAGCDPGRVFRDHAKDQIPHLRGYRLSPRRPPESRNQPPKHSKTCSVPANHCFWRDDDERLFPTGLEPPSKNPEEFVEGS